MYEPNVEEQGDDGSVRVCSNTRAMAAGLCVGFLLVPSTSNLQLEGGTTRTKHNTARKHEEEE